MTEIMWAIAYSGGIYCGTSMTRADAIAQHVHGRFRWHHSQWAVGGKLDADQRADWRKCRRLGDRAIRVLVTETTP